MCKSYVNPHKERYRELYIKNAHFYTDPKNKAENPPERMMIFDID